MKKRINYFFDTDILQVNPSNVHVMRMCQAFVRNGWDVTLYCTGDPEKIDLNSLFHQYGINNRFEIRVNSIPEILKKYGHRLGPWYASWIKSRMPMKEGYIYARSMMSMFFLRNKAPYIFEVHAEPDLVNRQFERAILRHRNCRGIVAISQALKQRYLELFPFIPENKITVLHDAADLPVMDSEEKVSMQGGENGPVIGYIGSLFPGKCMETLLPLAKRCPDLRFHIIGGTEYWIDLWRQQANAEGIENLLFYGHIDNGTVGAYYSSFDLCILPFSKDIYINKNKRVNIGKWTSPLKLFEAMAYSKPILVSRIPTIEEVLVHGEDCIMAEPDNIDDWEEKLRYLCSDRELQKKIGAAARKKLESEYTWQNRAHRAAEIFTRSPDAAK